MALTYLSFMLLYSYTGEVSTAASIHDDCVNASAT